MICVFYVFKNELKVNLNEYFILNKRDDWIDFENEGVFLERLYYIVF